MTIDGEPAKILLPYLQRADELQKHDHLAAYYCRLYAMEKGLKIPTKERTNETKLILISLMNQLEKDKKVVKLSPDDNMYMEGFALRVFAKADKQDRAGRADLKTAMTFYAASIFFEVLLQFGELPPDIQEKQKYASWKAVDIRKALAEGRKPVPGPPVTEKDTPDGEDPTSGTEGNTSSPPETLQQQQQQQPLSPRPPSEPYSGDFQHDSPSKSFEDFNLPSAPSNPIPPPSYTQNPYAPVDDDNDDDAGYPPPSAPSHHPPYPHTSATPKTIGTYSYPSDPPGFTTSPPPNYNSYYNSPAPQDPPPAAQYHHHPQQQPQQQPQWPSSASPYPSVFPSAAAPQYPSFRHSEPPPSPPPPPPPAAGAPRPSSGAAPVVGGGAESAGSGYPTGYQLNGSYDSEYKPSPGQVVEAHKASRFAVSALAFDDIPTAISYLRKSLELLTSPSAVE